MGRKINGYMGPSTPDSAPQGSAVWYYQAEKRRVKALDKKTNFSRDKEGVGKWSDKHWRSEAAGEYKGQWVVKGGVCLRNKVMLVGGR